VALAKPEPLTLEETQKLLSEDEAVVAFGILRHRFKGLLGDTRSYAWVVTRTRADWVEIPTHNEILRRDIASLRRSLTFEFDSDLPFDTALSYSIYQQTFGPIVDKLKGKTRLSVFAPGDLTSVPFGLLIASDPKGKTLKEQDWLIRSYAITVLPSIYSLKTMRIQATAAKAEKPMIAFADPVFAKNAPMKAKQERVALRSLTRFYRGSQLDVQSLADALPQLPGTRIEVERIAETLKVPKDDIKVGLDATETAVKQSKIDDYRVVYFATHGLVTGELQEFAKAKAEPALAFTIPDEPSDLDDGLLEASEVAQLKMNADWVVLSACNTASGDGVGAEPLSGLARAFLYAGGRSLVVSHWDVADETTAKLMSNLFQISKSKPNLSHGQMMREATLNLLDAATTDDDAHPRVWAPFVVVGEPARVQSQIH
jgi:CHAT domain-containing protein